MTCTRLRMLAAVLAAVGSARADGPATDLAPPVALKADGKLIDVDVGHAAPFVADLGDGRRTLLVGQFGDGKLRLYPDAGPSADPRFTTFEWFRAGDDVGNVPAG